MEMRVVQAPVQTVEEIYQSVCAAVASKKPIEAVYQGRPRLFCPHKLGRNREGIVARFAITSALGKSRPPLLSKTDLACLSVMAGELAPPISLGNRSPAKMC